MSKQFVAWARVSSLRQKKEGFSLEDQEARLREFATRLGGSIVMQFLIAETASKREERETFREFTTYVKKQSRRLSGMLFVRVDRAARNIGDWADLEVLSESTKVPLFFPDQPTGETPAGRMQRRMSAVFASYQTDQMASDIRGGQRRRIENGLPLGRQFGIRLVRVNGRSIAEHDPIDAPKVRRIFELFAYQPLTIDMLVETLARQGIIYSERAPRFQRSTLHRILHNRIYLGEVQYQGLWYPGKFEPLVDRATFAAVQERFGGKVYRKPEITFAGGIMRCGHCGHVITAEKKVKRSPDGTVRSYSYYRCVKISAEGHPQVRVSEPAIDRQFLDLFASLRIEDAQVRAWFVEVIRARAKSGQDESRQHRQELERQRGLVEQKLKTLLDLRMDGEISPEEYAEKRREFHERQSAIALQLESSQRDDREIAELAVQTFELSQSLCGRWVASNYASKRAILEILCSEIQLNSGMLRISLRKPFEMLRDEKLVPVSGTSGI